MKRYWLFSFSNFYPYGGMLDFTMDFDSIKEALIHFDKSDEDNANILDSHEKVVVYDSQLPQKYEVHGFEKLDKDEQYLNDKVTDSHLKNLYPVTLWQAE